MIISPIIFSVLFLIDNGIRIEHIFCKSQKDGAKYLVGLSYQLSTNYRIANSAIVEIKVIAIKIIRNMPDELEFVFSFEGV